MTGTDLIAKDILSVTINAVIGTRPGPIETLDRLRENQAKADPNQNGNLPAAATALATSLDDVEQGVIHRGPVVRLAQICRTYESYLSQAGIAGPPFRAEHMHLEERFGDEVLVTAPRTRKEGALVYCDTSKGDLVSVLIKPSDRVQEGKESLPSQVPWHTTEDQDLYYAAALPLRREVLAVQDQTLWPPTLDSAWSGKTLIWILFRPSSGYNVLAWIVDNADRTKQDHVSGDGRKFTKKVREREREKRRDGETEREKREGSGGIMKESKGLPCEVPTTSVI